MTSTSASISTITPRELLALAQQGSVNILDVRTPVEFDQVHARGAINLPIDRLDAAALKAQRDPDQPIYVICKSGGRSTKACERLAGAGFTRVVNILGGTDAWVSANLPIERNTNNATLSLERQVRIAAGLLVLTGVLLARFVSPMFCALSAFVGVGLIFAGVTDWCGMGMLLAKMPWNRRAAA